MTITQTCPLCGRTITRTNKPPRARCPECKTALPSVPHSRSTLKKAGRMMISDYETQTTVSLVDEFASKESFVRAHSGAGSGKNKSPLFHYVRKIK